MKRRKKGKCKKKKKEKKKCTLCDLWTLKESSLGQEESIVHKRGKHLH